MGIYNKKSELYIRPFKNNLRFITGFLAGHCRHKIEPETIRGIYHQNTFLKYAGHESITEDQTSWAWNCHCILPLYSTIVWRKWNKLHGSRLRHLFTTIIIPSERGDPPPLVRHSIANINLWIMEAIRDLLQSTFRELSLLPIGIKLKHRIPLNRGVKIVS